MRLSDYIDQLGDSPVVPTITEEEFHRLLEEIWEATAPTKERLQRAENILDDLSSGFWVQQLDDAAPEDRMGQRVLDYWRAVNGDT